MNKSEAILVLHEIYDVCKESIALDSVSIDPVTDFFKRHDPGYQIKMVGAMDSCDLKPILDKHRLTLTEHGDHVTLRPR